MGYWNWSWKSVKSGLQCTRRRYRVWRVEWYGRVQIIQSRLIMPLWHPNTYTSQEILKNCAQMSTFKAQISSLNLWGERYSETLAFDLLYYFWERCPTGSSRWAPCRSCEPAEYDACLRWSQSSSRGEEDFILLRMWCCAMPGFPSLHISFLALTLHGLIAEWRPFYCRMFWVTSITTRKFWIKFTRCQGEFNADYFRSQG